MVKQLWDSVKTLLALVEATRESTSQIAAIRLELKSLSDRVQDLAYKLERLRENEQHEREKTLLRLENQLLRLSADFHPAARMSQTKRRVVS